MNTNQSPRTDSARDLQWEIDRFLLADPSLDRDAFERRMLEDPSLAEQVAASVADLQMIVCAAKQTPQLAMPSTSVLGRASSDRTSRWAMVAVAAGLLVAISASAWQFRSASTDDQLAKIADNWTAFEGLSVADTIELVHPFDSLRSEDSIDSESSDQSDWLVEAAREFYLAKNEGAAG